MEELGKVLTELIRTGREIAPMALAGYFSYRILEVIIWPVVYFGIGVSVIRVIGLKLVDGWQTKLKTSAQALMVREQAGYIRELLNVELMNERRSKADVAYAAPEWYAEATTWISNKHWTS